MRRKVAKEILSADLSELSSMKSNLKDVDRALDHCNDALLIMRKFESVLDANGLRKKVNDASRVDLDALIAQIDKTKESLFNYSVKLTTLKELN